MNITQRITLASGLAVTAMTISGVAVHADGQAARSVPPTPIPADWVPLVDDTGAITVSVPPTWTDVNTSPFTGDDGATLPFIAASTDLQVFTDTFDAPGVIFAAETFNADTAAVAEEWGLSSGCANEVSEPYDDNIFVGTHVFYSGCGGGDAEYHVIAANPESQAFTAVVSVQLTGAGEQPVLDGIIASFNVAPSGSVPGPSVPATVPGSTVPGVPTLPSVPSVPTLPAPTVPGASVPPATDVTLSLPTVPAVPSDLPTVPADWVTVIDDSQTIHIAVPPTWTAVSTVASTDGYPWISATTDEELFFASGAEQYSVPGVIYMATPFSADTEAVNAQFAGSLSDNCTDGGSQPYDDGLFVGNIHTWTQCGGSTTTIYQIAANPADSAFTAMLLIQLTGQPDDAATLTALQLSFGAGAPASDPAATVPGVPTTLAGVPTTVAGAPTTAALGSTDPVIAFQETMAASGVTLTYDQASCWLEGMMQVDVSDMAAVQAAAEACGISV
jgi:hypothetical protein